MIDNFDELERLFDVQRAAQELAPGMIEWAGTTYESIIWRCDNPPSKKSVLDTAKKIETDRVWLRLRIERNRLLSDCDWTQLPDASCNVEAWAEYRQLLRDLPQNTDSPESPEWPLPPA